MKDLPNIYGFNKTSEAGKDVFAYSIFLQGCNFRCPYCMNARLVRGEVDKPIPIDEIKKSVEENDTEWVMISGGEPTFTDIVLLTNLIDEIRSWGCEVGMSTNGSKPDILGKIIDRLDFVAMDVKTASHIDYDKISEEIGIEVKERIRQSKTLLEKRKADSKGQFDYEIRTTLYPPFFRDDYDLYRMSYYVINKSDRWVFQQFRHNKNMLDPEACKVEPFSEDKLKEILEEAKKYCADVSIRYV